MNISELTRTDSRGNQTWQPVVKGTDVKAMIRDGARINIYGTAQELAAVSLKLTEMAVTPVPRKAMNRDGVETDYLAVNCNPPATASDFGF